MFWFSKMMKKKNYSDAEILKMFTERERLLNYRSNYAGNQYCFMVLKDEKTWSGGSHCAESALVYVNQIEQWGSRKRFIGITLDIGPSSLVDIQRVSNKLHDDERRFGIALHNLYCLGLDGDLSERVLWVFELGKKWYTAPPVLSLCLGLIRGGLKNLDTTNKNNYLYHMLKDNTPHGLFGASRSINWGKGNGMKNDATRFSSVYGIMSLNRDIAEKRRDIIDMKFPKHRLFGDRK